MSNDTELPSPLEMLALCGDQKLLEETLPAHRGLLSMAQYAELTPDFSALAYEPRVYYVRKSGGLLRALSYKPFVVNCSCPSRRTSPKRWHEICA